MRAKRELFGLIFYEILSQFFNKNKVCQSLKPTHSPQQVYYLFIIFSKNNGIRINRFRF
eukprot:UN26714